MFIERREKGFEREGRRVSRGKVELFRERREKGLKREERSV